jgi:eukaryotic-like serine/threonine-protein kinase
MVETRDEVLRLFLQAVELPAESRSGFLQAHCPDDFVRLEVLSLLEYDSEEAGIARTVKGAAALALGEDNEPPPASRVGPFEIGRLLGSGGMGCVYEAHRVDGEVRQRAAVKFARFHPAAPAAMRESAYRRFLRERQMLASLRHPYIAGLIDAGSTADGVPYAVIEQVDGVPIDRYCDASVAALDDRIRLVLKLCDAVQFAHTHLIVHRDIKPENVLITADGIPKLIDFGVATGLGEDRPLTMTRAFTPAYASPEQAHGLAPTVATDVYGIATVIYRLVTGTKPRDTGGTPDEVMRRISEEDVLRPSAVRPALKSDLENILLKALHRDSRCRYGSVAELADDLRRYLAMRPVRATPDSVLYRWRRFGRRNWVPVGATAALVAALVLTTVVLATQRQQALRRAAEHRRLAGTLLFEVHDEIGGLASAAKARARLGGIAVQYLEGLERDYRRDPELAWELLNAYSRLGQSLGGGASSVGDAGAAVRAASRTLEIGAFVESHAPGRDRLDKLFDAYVGLVPVFEQAQRPVEQHEAIDRLVRLAPRLGPLQEAEALMQFGRYLEAHVSTRGGSDAFERALAILQSLSGRQAVPAGTAGRLVSALAGFGRAQALAGNFPVAVSSLQEGIRLADSAVAQDPYQIGSVRQSYWCHIALGDVFGSPVRFNLGRPDEAISHYRKARVIAEGLVRADASNEIAQLDVARALTREAAATAASDPARALALLNCSKAAGRNRPLSPSRLEAQFTCLTVSVEPLVRLGELDKARQYVSEARRILFAMRQPVMEERSLLKADAIRLYAAGRPGEALEQAQKQLALLRGRTDPVLSVNFEAVELLGRIRTYAAGFDAAACTSATDRLVRIWDDLRDTYPHSSLVHDQRERVQAMRKHGCVAPVTN